MTISEDQELNFTVDSALLQELGEKLVESVHIALSELVKNAYDADANEVEIIFDQNSKGEDRIIIKDNGVGMNFQSVEDYWMRIATTNKEEKKVSKVYGRPLTGAKGIGRFSCRRLGKKLTLITRGTPTGKTIGEQTNIEQTTVFFDWKKFIPGKEVTSIFCPGKKERLETGITGTTLIIESINQEWQKRGLDYLKRQLAVLSANRGTKRKGFKEDTGFEVFLEAPDLEGGIRDIRTDLINAGWGTLTAYVNSKGQAICNLDALNIGKKSIASPPLFKSLSDVTLEVAIMVDEREQMRDTGILSKQTLKDILREWGGIQVKYRGFRVYPYGNDDWLNIDRDRSLRKAATRDELQSFANSLHGIDPKRALLPLLSMKSYVGSVFIKNGVPGLIMKANREGFIDSTPFEEIKSFVRFAIDWSTIWRSFYIQQEKLKKAQHAKIAFENLIGKKVDSSKSVSAALNHIQSTVSQFAEKLEEEEKLELIRTVKTASSLIKEENTSLLIELSQIRLIASTATLLLIFSHEVRSLLGILEQSRNTLIRLSKNITKQNVSNEILIIGDEFQELKNRLEDLLNLTSLVSNHKKKQETRIALKSRLVKIIKIFELITNKYDIKVDISGVPNHIIITQLLEAELYSILINIISNAVKAVIAVSSPRNIGIRAKVIDGVTSIIISDSGIGLNQELFEEVFIPFISDPDGTLYPNLHNKLNPEDTMFVGQGSGLGLGIVKEILRARGGKIFFELPQDGWNTQLVVQI